jgi:adenylate kinase
VKILLLGPPACGKGTIGTLLSEKLGLPLISVGKLLRELPEKHPHYKEIHKYMDKGELPSQKLVAKIIKERVGDEDCKKGYIMDGWGRRMEGFEFFDPDFDLILFLNITEEESVRRVEGRRVCKATGKTYNISTMSKEELAGCESDFIQRDDDKKEVVNHRWEVYRVETFPVIESLRSKKSFVEVNAEASPEEVFKNVVKALGLD